MTYEEREGIRRSDLWHIRRSPMHFKYMMDHKIELTKSDALRFGAAVHKFILEPETFNDEYLIAPEVNKRTKAGRDQWEEFELQCRAFGLGWVTLSEYEMFKEMLWSLTQNDLATQLLKGKHEQEFYWTDDVTGEACKCKCDCITAYEGKPYIVDYKTTESCENGHFERSARRYGYQFQAGMYCEGVFQNTFTEYGFAFVAQEKTPPYASRVYICDADYIKRGYDTFRELIGIYHDCKVSGKWYGYEGADNMPVPLLED